PGARAGLAPGRRRDGLAVVAPAVRPRHGRLRRAGPAAGGHGAGRGDLGAGQSRLRAAAGRRWCPAPVGPLPRVLARRARSTPLRGLGRRAAGHVHDRVARYGRRGGARRVGRSGRGGRRKVVPMGVTISRREVRRSTVVAWGWANLVANTMIILTGG